MSLVKRTYVDQVTVITAENLNAIQDAIIANEGAIEEQGEAIGGKYTKPTGGVPASDMASGVQTSLGKADSAYQKPAGGIPASDMASGVQTSLGKADSAYQEPAGGIPASDMASGVQTSLGKADSAYQKPSGGIPATDLASAVQTSLDKADTAYQKPSGGIPSTDLASAVQTSLGKADTALQSSDIDSTLTVAGKAADAKKTGDEISDVKDTLNTKVDKAGDTMTGNITISNTSPGVYGDNTSRTDGVAPSSSTNSIGYRLRDKNGVVVASFTDRWNADGMQGVWIFGARNGTQNGLYLLVDSSGNKVVYTSDAGAWRKGLDLCYTVNDTLEITSSMVLNGYVQTTSQLYFDCVVERSMENISTIRVTAMTGVLAGAGGVIDGSSGTINFVSGSAYTLSCTKQGNRHVRIGLKKSSAMTGATAHTPCCYFGTLTLKFT